MTRPTYGYVYGGTVTYHGEVHEIDGTAWSMGQCDEDRLRACALRDLSRSENVPIPSIEINTFFFSEIVTDQRGAAVEHPCADPFRPRKAEAGADTVDPFRPAD